MSKSLVRAGLAILIAGVSVRLPATGFYGPKTVLDGAGKPALAAPEFFWELECKRIAQEFVPPEKRRLGKSTDDQRAATEKTERAEAAKAGYLKGEDDTAGTEFEDYGKGAEIYGKEGGSSGARAFWEKLLQRPAAERKYRSTWAEYMLGKLCIDEKKYDDAVNHFQKTRQLAKEGFADGLGLAAESYGWEARAELDSGHAEKAARLYLTQLALGDMSAVISLKALIPDRESHVDEPDKNVKPLALVAYGADNADAALGKAAADPLLRRLVTAHVLATGVEMEYNNDTGASSPKPGRQLRWLSAIEKTGMKEMADAENLGWVAYSAGKYADAARWLKLAKPDSAPALWLGAKLALRDGKFKESAAMLSDAVHRLTKDETLENSPLVGDELFPHQSLNGDLGTVQLARSDFLHAVDAFLAAALWDDAAYVAERCLTTKELLDYVAAHPARPERQLPTEKYNALSEREQAAFEHEEKANRMLDKLRNLAARRLVREDDYKGAHALFDEKMQKILDDYTGALAGGLNERTPKRDRARALFHAAWIARYDGMELMGTEVGPDGGANEGAFGYGDLAMVRLTGKPHATEDREPGDDTKPAPVTFALPVSAEERKRLSATRLNPELRYHYRHVAAGLAWKAAGLLPDGSEETADVLNSAGSWIKDKHEKQADRFYQAIERRCSKTPIGKEAVKKHWFVETRGPWSDEEGALDQKAGRQRE